MPGGKGGSIGTKVTFTSGSSNQFLSNKSTCTDCPPTYRSDGPIIATCRRRGPADALTLCFPREMSSATSIRRVLQKQLLQPALKMQHQQIGRGSCGAIVRTVVVATHALNDRACR